MTDGDINLVPHSTDEFMKIVERRRSSRGYDPNAELTDQELSDLLWVAYGENPRQLEQGPFAPPLPPKALMKQLPHKTVAAGCGNYAMRLFLFMKKGIYEYIAEKNQLKLVKEGDLREKTGVQPFVKNAFVNIAIFCDPTIHTNSEATKYFGGSEREITRLINIETGLICENIYLFCSARNLKTVARGPSNESGNHPHAGDEKELRQILGLEDKYRLMIIQSVGK